MNDKTTQSEPVTETGGESPTPQPVSAERDVICELHCLKEQNWEQSMWMLKINKMIGLASESLSKCITFSNPHGDQYRKSMIHLAAIVIAAIESLDRNRTKVDTINKSTTMNNKSEKPDSSQQPKGHQESTPEFIQTPEFVAYTHAHCVEFGDLRHEFSNMARTGVSFSNWVERVMNTIISQVEYCTQEVLAHHQEIVRLQSEVISAHYREPNAKTLKAELNAHLEWHRVQNDKAAATAAVTTPVEHSQSETSAVYLEKEAEKYTKESLNWMARSIKAEAETEEFRVRHAKLKDALLEIQRMYSKIVYPDLTEIVDRSLNNDYVAPKK